MHASVLKYFVEVARCGSVRKASETLHVAASAVNRQILNLEEEMGVELFDRLPNGMRLNPAGERLLRHIQSTLHDFQVVRTEIDALKGDRSGHIKVVSMDSLFLDLLPAVVEEFSQVYPAATYTMTSAQPMDVAAAVLSGQADIGCAFVGRLPTGCGGGGPGGAAVWHRDAARPSAGRPGPASAWPTAPATRSCGRVRSPRSAPPRRRSSPSSGTRSSRSPPAAGRRCSRN